MRIKRAKVKEEEEEEEKEKKGKRRAPCVIFLQRTGPVCKVNSSRVKKITRGADLVGLNEFGGQIDKYQHVEGSYNTQCDLRGLFLKNIF